MSTFSQRLKEAREARGLSQDELAQRMKITRGACSHWESGRSMPNTKHLLRLAEVLQTSHMWLSAQGSDAASTVYPDSESADNSIENNNLGRAADARTAYESFYDKETSLVAERFFKLNPKRRKLFANLLKELSIS